MAVISNNEKGNKYHDEKTGEFTSPGAGSAAVDSAPQKLEIPNDDSARKASELPPTPKFKFKNMSELKNALNSIHQVSSIPPLNSARDIEEHLEQYFSKEVIDSIDEKFEKYRVPYKYYNLRTDPNEKCGVNIFAACIGKRRWKNNCLKIVDRQEYERLFNERSSNLEEIFRGIEASDDDTFNLIADSYSSKENEMIYGSSGGTACGIAFYSSTEFDDAHLYSNFNNRHIMQLLLNKNARTMDYDEICSIRNELYKRKYAIVPRVEQIFLKHGIEQFRAKRMAKSFGHTMYDQGFVAMLLGVEWYQYGDYHMVENLGTMYRLIK